MLFPSIHIASGDNNQCVEEEKYVPTGLSLIFDKIMAIISKPPVEAPHFNAIPTPIAEISPPKIAFNMISFETALTGIISKTKS